jgi:predicted phosphoribosyltransferase
MNSQLNRYRDRTDAGQVLADELMAHPAIDTETQILALPRGGVPVAYEVAMRLQLPLDVLIVRKLGYPGHEELAFGAIATSGAMHLNHEVLNAAPLEGTIVQAVVAREFAELRRRESIYRQGRPPLQVRDRTILIVDDGLATGSTMMAAIDALKTLKPRKIIVAVPVAPYETCLQIVRMVDHLVCPLKPEPFFGVGHWYERFDQTSDQEVIQLLELSQESFSRYSYSSANDV